MYVCIAPWRPINGTGQSTALTLSASVAVTNPVGNSSRGVMLSAEGGNCTVRISGSGEAATATDMLIKASDPPIIVPANAGDKITGWGLVAGVTLFSIEVSH